MEATKPFKMSERRKLAALLGLVVLIGIFMPCILLHSFRKTKAAPVSDAAPAAICQRKKTPGGVFFRSHLLLFTIISMDILAQASPYCNGKTLPIYCQFSANFLPPAKIVFCPVRLLISKYQQVSEIARLFTSFYFKSNNIIKNIIT